MPVKTSIFMSNKTQAVRLPKAVAFPDGVGEVEIIAIGHTRILSPVGHRWDDFFAKKNRVSDDFVRGDQGVVHDKPVFED